jgi:hypothetical protein
MIPFTDAEMKRACRQNFEASKCQPRTNAHRLLLFYAVECGLKTAIMKRERIKRTDESMKNGDFKEFGHDINKLLTYLHTTPELYLQETELTSLKPFPQTRESETKRPVKPADFNQMWRYGGHSEKDENIEKQLEKIIQWLEQTENICL